MEVFPHPYQQHPMPTPRLMISEWLLNSSEALRHSCHRVCRASRHSACPTLFSRSWPEPVLCPLRRAFFRRNSRGVDARLLCQGIHQCFMGDGGLRDTKAAERAGGRSIGQQGSCFCKNVRDEIGTAAVNRNPVRNGGAPSGFPWPRKATWRVGGGYSGRRGPTIWNRANSRRPNLRHICMLREVPQADAGKNRRPDMGQ